MAIVKTISLLAKQFRVSEWTKNGFLFAALLFAGKIFEWQLVCNALVAFFLFCALSSVVYVFNDWIDGEEDKHHPVKKNRPIASGALSIASAKKILLFLLLGTMVGCFFFNHTFFAWAILYLLLNLCYTLWLKKIIGVDILAVSANYIIRVMAGAAAIAVPITPWFISASTLLALFLAIGKRRYELQLLGSESVKHRNTLAGYSLKFLDRGMLFVAGIAILIYSLYTFDEHTRKLLHTSYMPLTIPFAIFGLMRYLNLVRKGKTGGSPAQTLLTDFSILLCVFLWLILVITILYLSH